MDAKLARIAEKLRIVEPSGAAAPYGRVGTRNDPYGLSPPLPMSAVVEFERTHRVRLPEGYRRFITEVGDGDGERRLYSLAEGYARVVDAYDLWTDWFGTDDDPLGKESLLRPNETYPPGWWDDNYGPDDRPDVLQGTLPVQEGGCSDFYLMVLNGPAAGAVFSANWDGNAEPTQAGDDYPTWFENSLDLLVLGYVRDWGVDDADGSTDAGEDELIRTLAEDPSEYRRMFAAWSLRDVGRTFTRDRRGLSVDALAALESATDDEHYIVRSTAVDTIGACAASSLEPVLRRVFDHDPDQEVRARAFWVLRDFGVSLMNDLALAGLDSDHPGLRQHAIQVLRERRALTAEVLSRLLDHPDWTTRREVLWSLADFDGSVTGLILKALDDPMPPIRDQAIDLAKKDGGDELKAKLRHMLDTTTDERLVSKLEFALGLRGPGRTGAVR